MIDRETAYLHSLLRELCALPKETEWLEFKRNRGVPDEIGEYLSALANSAALNGKAKGYLVWGVDDESHEIVGTQFKPSQAKGKGAEELENWLVRSLEPRIHFRIYEFKFDDRDVVLIEIPRAAHKPVRFLNEAFVRSGSYKKRLCEFPEKERVLWRLLDHTPFEDQVAADDVSDEDVLRFLDYPAYFEMFDIPLPTNPVGILARFEEDEMIARSDGGDWNITNLGAVLFARRLGDFRHLKRKRVRVVTYNGNDRDRGIREKEFDNGYAHGFSRLIEYVQSQLPQFESIGPAFRHTVQRYPEIAIRELVPNMMIHQDFAVTGLNPMIEIFDNRIEFTNAGTPLVEPDRFLGSPPRSRNEKLASFLRRLDICEERGSGMGKIMRAVESTHLPSPLFESHSHATRAVLFGPRPFEEMELEERIRACYWHACLRYLKHDYMTNASLRERFGLDPKKSPRVSEVIKRAVAADLIRPYEKGGTRKFAKYVPYWS